MNACIGVDPPAGDETTSAHARAPSRRPGRRPDPDDSSTAEPARPVPPSVPTVPPAGPAANRGGRGLDPEPASPNAVPARSVPTSAPTVPVEDRKSPPEDPSSGPASSAGPTANRTSPATDPISGTSPTSQSAGAFFKSAHKDAGSNTREVYSSTASGKEADVESLDLDMEITDEEDITGDEDQGSNVTTFNKINDLFREAIADISEGQDLLRNTNAQKTTSLKKKTMKKAKVRSAPQRERKSPRRQIQSKAPGGKSSARPAVQSNVKHNDAPIKLKGGPNGDMKRKLRRGEAIDK